MHFFCFYVLYIIQITIFCVSIHWGRGGPTPFFPKTDRKLDLGMAKNGEKKYMKREGNKLSISKIENIPNFSHDAPKFGFGDGKKWGKKYMEREGKSIRFNKLLYIIIIIFCILNKIFRVP